MYYEKAAYEEAEHAAKFAELLGEVVTDSTKKNLQMRVDAENGATAGKTDLAKRAKAANLDAIHDTVHEMARDEARHGKAFEGLLKRYFGHSACFRALLRSYARWLINALNSRNDTPAGTPEKQVVGLSFPPRSFT